MIKIKCRNQSHQDKITKQLVANRKILAIDKIKIKFKLLYIL